MKLIPKHQNPTSQGIVLIKDYQPKQYFFNQDNRSKPERDRSHEQTREYERKKQQAKLYDNAPLSFLTGPATEQNMEFINTANSTIPMMAAAEVWPYAFAGSMIGTGVYDAAKNGLNFDNGLRIGLGALPVIKQIPKGIKLTDKGLALLGNKSAQLRTIGRELNDIVKETELATHEPILNVGWGPSQTIIGTHASNKPVTKFIPFNRWDVKNHKADPYGYFVTEGQSAGIMSERPVQQTINVELKKPMVQVGEVGKSGINKNTSRNQLIRKARNQGADGYIMQDIADNKADHQNVIFKFIDREGESPITGNTGNLLQDIKKELPSSQTYNQPLAYYETMEPYPDYIQDVFDKVDNIRFQIEDAKNYWNSKERKKLNLELEKEARDLGFLSEDDQYAFWLNSEDPNVAFELENYYENGPKGMYNPNENMITLYTLDPSIAYHEGLHAYGAMSPVKTLFSNSKHFTRFPYQSNVGTLKFKRYKISKIAKSNIEDKLNPESFKSVYNTDPDEYVAYGRQAGKYLGIKDFEDMPSKEIAEEKWREAIEKFPYLKRNVESNSPVESRWKLLNGSFLTTSPLIFLNSLNERANN